MSGAASRFIDVLGNQAGLLVPDALEAGARVASNSDDSTPSPRIRRRSTGATVTKQEGLVTTDTTQTPAELQIAQDSKLAKMLDDCPTELAKSEMLININFIAQDLAKQAELLRNLDDEFSDQVMEEWFSSGNRLLKEAVWNAMAGSEEIPLAKAAPQNVGEQALAKRIDEATTPESKAHLLQKIASHTHDLSAMLSAEGLTDERREALLKGWLEADPRETELKKNILDAEMGRAGKAIYGTGVQADQVVQQQGGNASTDVSRTIGGSETGSDQSIARSLPRVPASALGTSNMPGQRDGSTPNPGSGPNDGGGGEVRPTIVRRKVATGGLGSVAGADTAGRAMTTPQDKTNGGGQARGRGRMVNPEELGRRKRDSDASKKRWSAMDKVERGAELVKIAPEALVDAILTIDDEDDQAAVCELAGEHAADLATWAGQIDPNVLQKRDLDGAIAAWLSEDPDTIQLKKWVAEALGTAEEIPLEMAKAIMEWEPRPAVRVRRPVGQAA